jgi:ribonuclease Z
VDVHEFDYRPADTVYEAKGVRIKSFHALHIYDGPVSYRLEWNGFSFAFSGDPTPSQFFVDNAKNCDLVVHHTFNSVSQLLDRFGDH